LGGVGAEVEIGVIAFAEPFRSGRGQKKNVSRILRAARIIRIEGHAMPKSDKSKQNLTICLDRKTIQKAKILAARNATSISEMVSREIENTVSREEAYEHAKRQALALLDEGFHLGGVIRATRGELHER
jgi:Family of unknown function (DUF6364)